MVYSSRFVLSVLLNGNIAPERTDGVVAIPFGSEYGIRCRNRHKNRRALVKLFVDNENISGGGFIIEQDANLDIFRRVDVDAALKFVELTSDEAEITGKNDNQDGSKGVIEARFYLEKEQPGLKFPLPKQPRRSRKIKQPQPLPLPYPYPVPVPTPSPAPWKYVNPYQPQWVGGTYTDNTLHDGGTTYCSTAGPQHLNCGGLGSQMKCSLSAEAPPVGSMETLLERLPVAEPTVAPAPPDRKLEEGCTVDGGLTGQRFRLEDFDAEEDFLVMKLVLRGFKPEASDKLGVTSIKPKEEAYCTNCGQRKARKADHFCGKCGHKF
jgi:hypothetical protein